MHNRAFAVLLRILAILILLIGVAMVALPPETFGRDPHFAVWTGLLLTVGAVAALLALASLLRRQAHAPPEVSAALNQLQKQAMELHGKISDLQVMYERASHEPQNAAKDYTSQIQHLAIAIEEIREITLLPDAERRQRATANRHQLKSARVNELFGLVAAHAWPTAERLIISLEAEFPDDAEVARGRSYLEHSRRLFEQETMNASVMEINDLVGGADWENAMRKARQLVQGFPTSGEARAVLERVQRDHEQHCQTTAQRLFDDIRQDVDRRMWRAALSRAKRLLECFPDNRLAEQIRGQMKTLGENAEIEERQELEVRIQEMIRGNQLSEAIDLAEDVIRRFPNSPQADSLDAMLPRIREMVQQHLEQDVQTTGAGE
jgi:uncharacterized membrane-anchored protein YhcB (DUF1043 family)